MRFVITKQYSLLSAFIAVMMSLWSINASAAVIDEYEFDLTGHSLGVLEEFILTESGLTLTITAWKSSFNTAQEQQQAWTMLTGDFGVYVGSSGIGAKSADGDGDRLDGGSSNEYDTDPDEGLLFTFSESVNLMELAIGSMGSDEDFNFSIARLGNSALNINHIFYDKDRPTSSKDQTFDFANDNTARSFMVWVDGDSDHLKLTGLTVVKTPEPQAAFLLMAALAFVGLHRMRR